MVGSGWSVLGVSWLPPRWLWGHHWVHGGLAWRYDKGLWMLSALFLAVAFLCYGGFTYGHVSDIIHHRGKTSDMIDLSFAASLLWMQSRFLLTVTTSNWKLTRR